MKICIHCGTLNFDTSQYCKDCGKPLPASSNGSSTGQTTTGPTPTSQTPPNPDPGKKPDWKVKFVDFFTNMNWKKKAVLAMAACLIVAASFLGVATFSKANVDKTMKEPVKTEKDLKKKITVLNKNKNDESKIDTSKTDHKVGKVEDSLTWDSSIFYTLEDVNKKSSKDGKIKNYSITKKRMIDEATGNQLDFYIYSNPETGTINKITTIEYTGQLLNLTDYYYENDGSPNFVFKRKDSVFTQTYASPSKYGTRYYLAEDNMVKWRVVNEKGIKDFCKNKATYDSDKQDGVNRILYSSLSAANKKTFDEKEVAIINEAYNIMEAAKSKYTSNILSGRVCDADGKPIKNAKVKLYCKKYDGCIYKTRTDADGYYCIYLPNNNLYYWLTVSAKGYISSSLYRIHANGKVIYMYQPDIYLIKDVDDLCRTNIDFIDAISGEAVNDVDIKIRSGMNNKKGKVIWPEKDSDEGHVTDGYISLTMPYGVYTVEANADGYNKAYYNLVCKDGKTYEEIVLSPLAADNEMRVVLQWNTSEDLDAHLFTPQLAASDTEDDCHIWYKNMSGNGAELDTDVRDGSRAETITIDDVNQGTFKYYVSDFTDLSAGDYESANLSNSGATVNVYNSEGLVESFTVSGNQSGAVWEVFEISNGEVIPAGRYYTNVDDKPWWQMTDKDGSYPPSDPNPEPDPDPEPKDDDEMYNSISQDFSKIRNLLGGQASAWDEEFGTGSDTGDDTLDDQVDTGDFSEDEGDYGENEGDYSEGGSGGYDEEDDFVDEHAEDGYQSDDYDDGDEYEEQGEWDRNYDAYLFGRTVWLNAYYSPEVNYTATVQLEGIEDDGKYTPEEVYETICKIVEEEYGGTCTNDETDGDYRDTEYDCEGNLTVSLNDSEEEGVIICWSILAD